MNFLLIKESWKKFLYHTIDTATQNRVQNKKFMTWFTIKKYISLQRKHRQTNLYYLHVQYFDLSSSEHLQYCQSAAELCEGEMHDKLIHRHWAYSFSKSSPMKCFFTAHIRILLTHTRSDMLQNRKKNESVYESKRERVIHLKDSFKRTHTTYH